MDLIEVIKKGKSYYYSFSPDKVLNDNNILDAHLEIRKKFDSKDFYKLYKAIEKIEKKLVKSGNFSVGYIKSIVSSFFLYSNIYYLIFFFIDPNIYKIKKCTITTQNPILRRILQYLNINHKISSFKKNALSVNKFDVLQYLNFEEIFYYLKKKYFKNKKKKYLVYKDCSLLVHFIKKKKIKFEEVFFIKNLNFKKKTHKKTKESVKNFIFNVVNLEINKVFGKKIKRDIIFKINELIIKKAHNEYFEAYDNIHHNLNKIEFHEKPIFLSNALFSSFDFAILDYFKFNKKSQIITFQHGHGQEFSIYHDKIKFIKEPSYSNIFCVYADKSKKFFQTNFKNNCKAHVLEFPKPFNISTKLNQKFDNYDYVFFSPFQTNGFDHTLYNYNISDIEKIEIQKNIIDKSFSKTESKIIFKKYPYNFQKFDSENYLERYIKPFNNIYFMKANYKYANLYSKKHILICFGCSSTFGYLSAFNLPIIIINYSKFFPFKKNVLNQLNLSYILLNFESKNFYENLKDLINNKNYVLNLWKKKAKNRKIFNKKYLGI